VFVHEAGHYIDHHVLGTAGNPASYAPAWEAWRQAVRGSQAIQKLRRAYLTPGAQNLTLSDGTVVTPADQSRYLQYLLRTHEVFARSYCQYIVYKSGDKTMTQSLSASIGLHYPEQWTNRDFKPIRRVFDRQFDDLDWKHPQPWTATLKKTVLRPFQR
jgi:hypothetical protein